MLIPLLLIASILMYYLRILWQLLPAQEATAAPPVVSAIVWFFILHTVTEPLFVYSRWNWCVLYVGYRLAAANLKEIATAGADAAIQYGLASGMIRCGVLSHTHPFVFIGCSSWSYARWRMMRKRQLSRLPAVAPRKAIKRGDYLFNVSFLLLSVS